MSAPIFSKDQVDTATLLTTHWQTDRGDVRVTSRPTTTSDRNLPLNLPRHSEVGQGPYALTQRLYRPCSFYTQSSAITTPHSWTRSLGSCQASHPSPHTVPASAPNQTLPRTSHSTTHTNLDTTPRPGWVTRGPCRCEGAPPIPWSYPHHNPDIARQRSPPLYHHRSVLDK